MGKLKVWGISSMAGCLAALCLLAAGPAEGLSPPVPEKATVYFSNGGRIVSMKSDGSERTVLTRRSRVPKNTTLGDHSPDISPNGFGLIFMRTVADHGSGQDRERSDSHTDILLAQSDGTSISALLAPSDRYRYPYATWMPDGRVLVSRVELNTRRPKSSFVAIDPLTDQQQVLYTLSPVKDLIGKYPARELSDPAVSPDGAKVLFDLGFAERSSDPSGLHVLDLATGKIREIDRMGADGSWSPDGLEIVYAASTRSGHSTEICAANGYDCSRSRHLVTARADGSKLRRLTADSGDARSPDWSADGSRIVFQGNRNMPETAESYEIYSITPQGQCLTWLTNGAPASLDPAWSGAPGQEYSAGSCGDRDLKPLQELTIPKQKKGRFSLWLGEVAGWRLFSGLDSYFGPVFNYSDCAYFQPGKCGVSFGTFNVPVCVLRGRFAKSGFGNDSWAERRGLPYSKSFGDGSRIDVVFSGKSLFYMMGDDNRSNADTSESIRYLRVYGRKRSAGLPPIRVPRQDLRKHRQVVKAVRRTGSVKTAARRLGMSVEMVRANLGMSRFLKRFGPVTPVSCLHPGPGPP